MILRFASLVDACHRRLLVDRVVRSLAQVDPVALSEGDRPEEASALDDPEYATLVAEEVRRSGRDEFGDRFRRFGLHQLPCRCAEPRDLSVVFPSFGRVADDCHDVCGTISVDRAQTDIDGNRRSVGVAAPELEADAHRSPRRICKKRVSLVDVCLADVLRHESLDTFADDVRGIVAEEISNTIVRVRYLPTPVDGDDCVRRCVQ